MSGTAKIEDATLSPSKIELLSTWLGAQPWFVGDPDAVERVSAFRFVDPDGEVGIETLLLRSNGVTYQVPVTYRGAPLEQAELWLIGTLEHSVLGTRWVYDAVGDPVYVGELTRVIRERDTESELSRGRKTATVRGTGSEITAAATSIELIRVPANDLDAAHTPPSALLGTWTEDGEPCSAVLAILMAANP